MYGERDRYWQNIEIPNLQVNYVNHEIIGHGLENHNDPFESQRYFSLKLKV